MDAFQVYRMYVAMRLHFNGNYDYFKYHGKVKSATKHSFEIRRDKYYFHKLSKKDNVELRIASGFMEKPDLWIGDLFEEKFDAIYKKTLKYIESMEYSFRTEMSQYATLDYVLTVPNDGGYPRALKDNIEGRLSNETMVILNGTLDVFNYWSGYISDTILWPINRTRLEKYSGFIQYDKQKYNKILLDIF